DRQIRRLPTLLQEGPRLLEGPANVLIGPRLAVAGGGPLLPEQPGAGAPDRRQQHHRGKQPRRPRAPPHPLANTPPRPHRPPRPAPPAARGATGAPRRKRPRSWASSRALE